MTRGMRIYRHNTTSERALKSSVIPKSNIYSLFDTIRAVTNIGTPIYGIYVLVPQKPYYLSFSKCRLDVGRVAVTCL